MFKFGASKILNSFSFYLSYKMDITTLLNFKDKINELLGNFYVIDINEKENSGIGRNIIQQSHNHPNRSQSPLPNLIVVGDQSSGKSSLLCKLSSFPPSILFPVSSGRCTTKCVTKLILRTSQPLSHHDNDNDNDNDHNNDNDLSTPPSKTPFTARVSTSLSPHDLVVVKDDMEGLGRAIDKARSRLEGASNKSVTTGKAYERWTAY